MYYTVYTRYNHYEGASSPRVRSGHAQAGSEKLTVKFEIFYQKRGEMAGVGASGTRL